MSNYHVPEDVTLEDRIWKLLFDEIIFKLVIISTYVIIIQYVKARVYNITGEESVLLCNSLYKRILQSISTFHRLLP